MSSMFVFPSIISDFTFQAFTDCHPFVALGVCLIQINPCDATTTGSLRGYPCQSACEYQYRLSDRCRDLIKPYKEFNTCEFLPSEDRNEACLNPTRCPEPRAPTHGSVKFNGVTNTSEAVYDCNVLFELKGDKVTIHLLEMKLSHCCKSTTFLWLLKRISLQEAAGFEIMRSSWH